MTDSQLAASFSPTGIHGARTAIYTGRFARAMGGTIAASKPTEGPTENSLCAPHSANTTRPDGGFFFRN